MHQESVDIRYAVFGRPAKLRTENYKAISEVADKVLKVLRTPVIKNEIEVAHKVGAASQDVQAVIEDEMHKIGFSSEKKGLFSNYTVSGIRPDYYININGQGVLFEVERGKTIANNMDLLDVWKTHLCKEASHLFLLVPNVRQTNLGKKQKIFSTVCNRVETFFNEEISEIDVDSVHVFGY